MSLNSFTYLFYLIPLRCLIIWFLDAMYINRFLAEVSFFLFYLIKYSEIDFVPSQSECVFICFQLLSSKSNSSQFAFLRSHSVLISVTKNTLILVDRMLRLIQVFDRIAVEVQNLRSGFLPTLFKVKWFRSSLDVHCSEFGGKFEFQIHKLNAYLQTLWSF